MTSIFLHQGRSFLDTVTQHHGLKVTFSILFLMKRSRAGVDMEEFDRNAGVQELIDVSLSLLYRFYPT